MKRNSLFASAALLGMLFASTTSARADFGTVDFLAQKIINSTNTEGAWHVIVSNGGPGNVWNVFVQADSGSVPNNPVEHIQIAFFSSSADAQSATNPLAIVSNSDLSNGFLAPGLIDWTGGAQVGNGGTNKQFNSDGSEEQSLKPDGSNQFIGQVTVTDSSQIKAIAARLDDTTMSWRGSGDLVPEASSLALLLPGTVPLGLFIRRSRRKRNK